MIYNINIELRIRESNEQTIKQNGQDKKSD